MEAQVRQLVISHAVALVLSGFAGFLAAGISGAVSAASGLLAFSLPVILFSFLVLKATTGDSNRFWGRFLFAEVLKWLTSGTFLALAFASGQFLPLPLLLGFFVSVLVQLVFPIFVKRGSES